MNPHLPISNQIFNDNYPVYPKDVWGKIKEVEDWV